jgi:hypothetical protein
VFIRVNPRRNYYFSSAKIRTGPPEPPSNFAGEAIKTAPEAGTALKSATFSKWYTFRPDV